MNHVMLDIETIGKGSNAAIISIGAVFFCPDTNKVGAEFHTVIDPASAAFFGEMDASTIKWWMQQDDEARALFNRDDAVKLKVGLDEFYEWVSQIENVKDRIIWGNGATFDNVILANAYRSARMKQPWAYFNDRDVRTIVALGRELLNFDPKKDMPFEGVKHDALDDARHQAKYVNAIYQALKNNGVAA
ncbi:3'-5' exonuclease [Pseudoalteromonas ruthenica]|uniref:3'-5' exonuclease n=1 Tax=Pseudoalteromonas ruthenica TaxID=151081 RepID=UPI00110A2997|nr:3'-5' exonuclease [Pseudoalteromonas ruthenica]TMO97570.1 3'-5' exoribonuclease [Pseudoalteromonas ruthenica]